MNNEVLCFAQDKLCSNFINSYWATEHGGIMGVYDSQHIQKDTLPTTHNYPLPWIDACIQVRDKDKNLGDVVIQKPYPYLFYTVWGDPLNYTHVDWTGDSERYSTYFSSSAGYEYFQGDSAIQHEDGSYSFHGRSDRVMNIGGNRVGTEQIENALLLCVKSKSYTHIKNVVVVSKPSKIYGEVPIVFMTTTSSVTLVEKTEMKSFLKTELGAYCVPNDFVVVDELPETISGKYSRSLLRKILKDDTKYDTSSLKNPECVEAIKKCLHMDESIEKICTRQHIREIITKCALQLGVTHLHLPWMDAGIDSITSQNFVEALNTSFGSSIALTPMSIFDYPNAHSLEEHICSLLLCENTSVGEKKCQDVPSKTTPHLHSLCHVTGIGVMFPGNIRTPNAFGIS